MNNNNNNNNNNNKQTIEQTIMTIIKPYLTQYRNNKEK